MATNVPKTKWSNNISIDLDERMELPPANTAINLSYVGKTPEEVLIKLEPPKIKLLWENPINNNTVNGLYFGDNFNTQLSLITNNHLKEKINLIYIDPPYSTGGVFQSRSQKDAYTDLLSGASFIEFLRQRLILLRELLAEDGSIYLHLDHNMATYIKVILDEVFGKKNFRNWITRKKSNPKNYTRNTFGNISDVILFYTKSDNYIWNRPYEKWETKAAHKEYIYIEKETGRRFKKVPIHAPGVRKGETGKTWKGKLPPPGKHWQLTPEKLDKLDAKGEIFWSSTGNPRRKLYLDQSPGKQVQDIWLNYRDAFNQNHKITGYPTEKNQELLELIIQTSSNPGDLVLDSFAGSGTTLAAASSLNRRWIGIDNSSEAIKTILKRFAFGREPMGDFVNTKKKTIQPKLFQTKDFNIFVIEPYNNDIDDIIHQWSKWIS